ncbi:MAG: 50S ribosomal protein L35 [Patescibacteria group bacterium]|jgi:ribosomal protein L35
MKTNKSFTKRIKVTRTGKLVVRKAGQDHFNAKERGRTKAVKNRPQSLTVTNDVMRRFLGGHGGSKKSAAAKQAIVVVETPASAE